MPRLAVRSKFGNSETMDNMKPHCPTPRRLTNNLSEFIIPLTCTKHSQHTDPTTGILNLISHKENEGRETKCNGCITSCYSESPPDRTHNPLIHDVVFHHLQESNFLTSLPNSSVTFTN